MRFLNQNHSNASHQKLLNTTKTDTIKYDKSSMKLVYGHCYNVKIKTTPPPIFHKTFGVMGFYQHIIKNQKSRPTCVKITCHQENFKKNKGYNKANNKKKKALKTIKETESKSMTITKEEYKKLIGIKDKWYCFQRGCISCINFTKKNNEFVAKCCKCFNYVCQTHLKQFGMNISNIAKVLCYKCIEGKEGIDTKNIVFWYNECYKEKDLLALPEKN